MPSERDKDDIHRTQMAVVFSDYLTTKGKWLNAHRQQIVEIVESLPMQFTDDQVIADARRGRATVYRTLLELVDAGLLERSGHKYVRRDFG